MKEDDAVERQVEVQVRELVNRNDHRSFDFELCPVGHSFEVFSESPRRWEHPVGASAHVPFACMVAVVASVCSLDYDYIYIMMLVLLEIMRAYLVSPD